MRRGRRRSDWRTIRATLLSGAAHLTVLVCLAYVTCDSRAWRDKEVVASTLISAPHPAPIETALIETELMPAALDGPSGEVAASNADSVDDAIAETQTETLGRMSLEIDRYDPISFERREDAESRTFMDELTSDSASLVDSVPGPIRGRGTRAVQGRGANQRGEAMGSGPDPRPVAFFGVEGAGDEVVFVLDRSNSMESERSLDLAKRELARSLEALRPGARFQIIVYAEHARFLAQGGDSIWAHAHPLTLEQLLPVIRDLPLAGGTDHDLAWELAMSIRPRVVFFLTDADKWHGRVVDHLKLQERRIRSGKLQIHFLLIKHHRSSLFVSPRIRDMFRETLSSVQVIDPASRWQEWRH